MKMDSTTKIKVGVTIVAVAAILVGFLPRKSSFGFDYRKGSAWEYETLYAQFDFPIYKTEEQIMEERAASSRNTIPYYRYSSEQVEKNLKIVDRLQLGDIKPATVSCIKGIYEKGVVSDEGVRRNAEGEIPDVIFIQKEKRAAKCPSSEVYRLSDARTKLLNDVSSACPDVNVDSIFLYLGVYELINPNLAFDLQTTELVNTGSSSAISPTQGYVSTGQLIVSNGEIITSEIAQMIDSYRKEYDSNFGYEGPRALMWLGNSLIALMLSFMLFFAVFFTKPSIFRDSRYPYIVLIFLLTSIGSLLVIKLNEGLLLFLPFTLCALYLQAFFKARVIIPVYITSMMPILIYADNGIVVFTMFFLAGLTATYAFKFLGRGWLQFVVMMITFAVMALSYCGFRLVNMIGGDDLRNVFALFVSSFLAVAGYPLIYLFEKIFNLVSNSRLNELCDTSNSLLRKLEQKAPGTFQHSLQVMNMSDAAARAIDVSPLLVRAGALYHDIGKMNNPQCFVENESLVGKNEADKYHFNQTPIQSARDIIRHVTDGIEIAQKNRLPRMLVSFIRTHHGTSRVGYFWNKYLNEGGDPDAESEFRYPGERPKTKEQTIVMICDSVEAASRTLKDYSPEAVSEFVDKIVNGKLDEGQLEESDITVRELVKVREAVKSYIAQMHHERITYPERKNLKQILHYESRTEKN